MPTLRSRLTLLLLLNYLLVVGAGLVERPARPIERAFAYVHSTDCQLRHTLRAGCFDDCNGTQYQLTKPGERVPLHQLLASYKGLDVHCLLAGRPAELAPRLRLRQLRPMRRSALRLPGHSPQAKRPPRCG